MPFFVPGRFFKKIEENLEQLCRPYTQNHTTVKTATQNRVISLMTDRGVIMKNLIERLRKASGRLQDCIRRFPFSFTMLCMITATVTYIILTDDDLWKLTVSLIMGGLFCFLMELSHEYKIHKTRILAPAVGLIVALLVFLILKDHDNEYVYTALGGIIVAVVALLA